MNRAVTDSHRSISGAKLLLAGAAGGLAEVIWVALYAALTPAEGAQIAREITVSVFGGAPGSDLAPAIGITIHRVLAVAVAAAFAALLWRPVFRRFGAIGVMAASVAALATVWTINFFVVLPIANPAFVTLMPLSVTLASKLLFGISMGAVLCTAPQSGRPDFVGWAKRSAAHR